MVRHTKKHKKLRRSKRRSRGGGYSDNPSKFVSPGNVIHQSYAGDYPHDGPKDCTGNSQSYRPGYLFNYSAKGLPGLSGGGKRNRRNKRGGSQLGVAPIGDYGFLTHRDPALTAAGSVTSKPGYFPDTTGSGGTVANPVEMSMPGVPTPLGAVSQSSGQKGGRYGFFPELGPVGGESGIGGSSYSQVGRIPCERGTFNPLNLNPNGIQQHSTAPSSPPYMTSSMRGGASIPAGSGLSASGGNFPVVKVGDVDAMRYYAPTAGYTNVPQTFPGGSATPGYMIQPPYNAREFNRACVTTGGSRRKNKKRGGSHGVASSASPFSPVKLSEVMNRSDFDGTTRGLPVKFGGSRRRHRRPTKRTKRHRRH